MTVRGLLSRATLVGGGLYAGIIWYFGLQEIPVAVLSRFSPFFKGYWDIPAAVVLLTMIVVGWYVSTSGQATDRKEKIERELAEAECFYRHYWRVAGAGVVTFAALTMIEDAFGVDTLKHVLPATYMLSAMFIVTAVFTAAFAFTFGISRIARWIVEGK